MRRVLFFLLLCPLLAFGQDQVSQVSSFHDSFGNLGSFWLVRYQGKDYALFKLKSNDEEGDADIVLDADSFAKFEELVEGLHRSKNSLKDDGFTVLDTLKSDQATLAAIHGRLNGVRFKLLQITVEKPGEPKREHRITIDDYSGLRSALAKFKRKLPW
ncbi:MAG: hypothetical protein AB7S38_34720 [Vulcanimicrobiota bacterium]